MSSSHRTIANDSLAQRIQEWAESFACRVSEGTPKDPNSSTWGFLLEPTDVVQGMFKTTVTWVPDPVNMLVIEATLAVGDPVQRFVNNLASDDIARVILDSYLHMSLCEEAEYEPVVPELENNQISCPTEVKARSFIAVDDTLSRARFYDSFMRVQRIVRSAIVYFQRVQLRRELLTRPEGGDEE